MWTVEFVTQLLKLRFQLSRRDRWSRGELEAQQRRSLSELRRHVYKHSPFYRESHRGRYDSPLEELPVLTKSIVMDRFDDLVTDRSFRFSDVEAHLQTLRGNDMFRGRYWLNATSGSTGRRGLFLFDSREWATVIAGFGRANLWAGAEESVFFRRRFAVVASNTPWHMSMRVFNTVRNPWTRVLHLDAGESSGRVLEALNRWQPTTLAVYPSSLRLLAREQLAGRLRIVPRTIYTGGEVLFEEVRQLARDAWGTEVFDQYGATETGNMAAECSRHNGLHINEDMVIVEVVDGANRPVPAGEYGDKLLVTVLFNTTQPLIRYEISDRLRLASSPCPCGKPYRLLESVQGRAEEVLEFPTSTGGLVQVHPIVLERVLDALPAAEWQVIQEGGRLRVLLSGVREDFQDREAVDSLLRALGAQGVDHPSVEIVRVPSIPRGATGKAPIVRKGSHP
jgi:putative adenylate-forming enzyme